MTVEYCAILEQRIQILTDFLVFLRPKKLIFVFLEMSDACEVIRQKAKKMQTDVAGSLIGLFTEILEGPQDDGMISFELIHSNSSRDVPSLVCLEVKVELLSISLVC